MIKKHTWGRQWFVMCKAMHQNFDYNWFTQF